MSNMSHCRFHNTLADLADCRSALKNLYAQCLDEPLSEDEAACAADLLCCAVRTLRDAAQRAGQPLDVFVREVEAGAKHAYSVVFDANEDLRTTTNEEREEDASSAP